ncbi:Uncharacterised protein [Moraxella lacunata]|uniref:Uncharacterized protein n=1 Tax=Moraxella lacunata TaxID=477 RepID=A0A378T544_MORLA|nr:hypothetical protein [Moraxella lacunata]STZ55770.1 Uncharacterised protein [Moraxella lacunata]
MKTNSKRRLKRLIERVNTVIMAWGSETRPKRHKFGETTALPPLYQVMAYQGEAILLQRFFGVLRERLGMDMEHRAYLAFYEQAVEHGGFLLDFISRTEWLTIVSGDTSLPNITKHQAKQLYCILLAAISERSPAMISVACDELFIHLYKQQFPSQTTTERHTTTDQLRHKLTNKLRKITHTPCQIKESFHQDDDKVVFCLMYRKDDRSRYEPLISLERPRLKTARLSAYQTLLDDDNLADKLNPVYELASKKKRIITFKDVE